MVDGSSLSQTRSPCAAPTCPGKAEPWPGPASQVCDLRGPCSVLTFCCLHLEILNKTDQRALHFHSVPGLQIMSLVLTGANAMGTVLGWAALGGGTSDGQTSTSFLFVGVLVSTSLGLWVGSPPPPPPGEKPQSPTLRGWFPGNSSLPDFLQNRIHAGPSPETLPHAAGVESLMSAEDQNKTMWALLWPFYLLPLPRSLLSALNPDGPAPDISPGGCTVCRHFQQGVEQWLRLMFALGRDLFFFFK